MADPNDPEPLPTQQWSASDDDAPMPTVKLSDQTIEGLLGGDPPVTRGGWQPPTPEELQARLPQYEINELLGRGGMGAVYKGWQKSLDRFVAIKILPPDLTGGDVDYAARFKREAKSMARLKHPGIIPVFDAGETTDGLLYFIMDFVEGTDVQKLVAAQGRLPVEQALGITTHVLDALAYAHEHGIIHRDIKPANILVDTKGHVLVADFGLARSVGPDSTMLTVSNMAMGTPDFMAPESQLGMDQVDHRADLYAVGVMLYQMLTGKLPRGRFEPPSRAVPGLDRRLDVIIDRTLQAERDARYSSALELRSALEPVLTRTVARRIAASGRTSAAWKKPLLLAIAAVVVIGAGTFFAFKKPADNPQRPSVSEGAATPSPTKEVPFVNSLGMKFVPVPIVGRRSSPPGGQFEREREVLGAVGTNDRPTTVLFSVWDTRVRDYAAYAQAEEAAGRKVDGAWKTAQKDGEPVGREPDHPVVSVSWEDAQRFCAWLTEKEHAEGKLAQGLSYRLPTDHEWSCAVGIGEQEDAGKLPAEKRQKISGVYPWGQDYPPGKPVGNYADETFHAKFPPKQNEKENRIDNEKWVEGYEDGYATTSPVGAFPANAYGLYDLGGNVWQWCEDWYDDKKEHRILRGASWRHYDRTSLLSSYRNLSAPGYRIDNCGFRCVVAGVSALRSDSTVASSAPSVQKATAAEPGAIRLWDSPEKIPKQEGVSWEDNALRLDKAVVRFQEKKSSDAILRFSFRVQADNSGGVNIIINRQVGGYTLAPNFSGEKATLELRRFDSDGSYHVLQNWPCPESYPPGEWVSVELKAIRNRFTVKVNGQILGTVEDANATLSEAGIVAVRSTRVSYLREIVYVPLDGAAPPTQNEPAR